ncbi:NDR1/HIN1-like protein 10 [Cannabis sativa]|uniref:NDR1/HIN1-like protein 10 n=1 Tax=Cannabis sativa TaxID=3483 RepID=UPI0029CA516B|nr:NDR1/HIN1-like protein 10 [Cannabis sativa]
MDVQSEKPKYFCHGKFCHEHSFKRSCLFLFLFIFFVLLLIGIAALIIAFVIKPKSPIFSLQSVKLDLYELNPHLGSTLFISSVITLTLSAQNPNKVGIRYSPSRLHVYHEGLSIGTIRVPGFLQPAHSYNMTVPTRILFQSVNVSHIFDVASMQEDSKKNMIQMKIMGDVKTHLLAFHVTLLKIKVALECDIDVDVKQLSIQIEVSNIKRVNDHMASLFPTTAQTIFRKCALAFYI